MVWLKFIHMAAISIWCGGLICLPGLYAQRHNVETDDALYRLQGLVRFAYVSLISPAAFVAVGSGIVLFFLQGTFVEWFSLKMAFVGVLVSLVALVYGARSVRRPFVLGAASALAGVALAVLGLITIATFEST